MTGLDRWIAWDKPDFIGKAAAQNTPAPTRVLAMLEVDADLADPTGFEPVWSNGRCVGITTSGGYGHRLQKSFAMALVEPDFASVGAGLSVHVMGEERPATVIAMSPYDPTGERMRV